MASQGFETGGNIVERDLFGSVEGEAAKKELVRMKLYEAMSLVRDCQPGDPHDPKPVFAYEVFVRVENLLKDLPPEALSFFTAVRSPLDRMGVDGWFEVTDGGRVTIDLTTNPLKDSGKADLIFHVPRGGFRGPIKDEEDPELLRYADDLAKEVADRLERTRHHLTTKH